MKVQMKTDNIVEYKMITTIDAGTLNTTVNKMISEGWQPYGSPCFSNFRLCQAMVKYEVHRGFSGGPK